MMSNVRTSFPNGQDGNSKKIDAKAFLDDSNFTSHIMLEIKSQKQYDKDIDF